MFQDIAPHVLNNQYTVRGCMSHDYLIFTKGQKILVKISEGNVSVPTVKELENEITSFIEKDRFKSRLQYLIEIDDMGFFLCQDSKHSDRLEAVGYEYIDRMNLRNTEPNHLSYGTAVAFHIALWYENNVYCGKCATPYEHSKTERALTCPKCGQILYPRINPAVIVAVHDGDRLLLSKYAGRPYAKYALIAGFYEVGETVEECVKREVMEETGLKVKNIKYFNSQPWPFTQGLLLGFFAELDGNSEVHIDENELAEATWFNREDIPNEDSTLSLTRTMMEYFREHKDICSASESCK